MNKPIRKANKKPLTLKHITTVKTNHTAHPWVLVIHHPKWQKIERFKHRKEAELRATVIPMEHEEVFLIELFVDAGALYAVG